MPEVNIRAAADKALASLLPSGKRVAVVGAVTTQGGKTVQQLGFALRLNEHWTVSDELAHSAATGLLNAFYVVGSW